ncbi:MAG: cytochrome ubiquinol oxidase subunit I [Bifidobacteriaceae bacterium]|jgi:cytochrome d ubiquinol oxidase subunit I|nr:cytochrome ubiquinol oxidase subunit I [Bifidobacteriaceae bacterium]
MLEALDLARWQFGITTVYHFIFVPLTIGLTPLVALLQTIWYKTGKDEWYRLTRFFGKLLLINFALGIVTGIVQEFQFGMNWSEYSRMVGDIFGAPLAMEALAAFFIESTFLGVWIFGWGRLSRGVHLLSIWLVAFAVNLSAFFILAANSFMQYPVGSSYDPVAGRAQMDSLGSVLFSQLSLSTFWHTISTSFVVAGTFMAGIAIWWVVKAVRAGNEDGAKVYRKAGVVGCWVVIIAGISLIFSGHHQAQVITKIQPTKMAAAEMLCVTPAEGEGAGFTVVAFGECAPVDPANLQGEWTEPTRIITIPKLLSLLAYNDTGAQVTGINDAEQLLQDGYQTPPEVADEVGLDFIPNQMTVFWTFRLMIAFGAFSALLALVGLFALRGGRTTGSGFLKFWSVLSLPMPFLGAAFGWIFTEIGRQPFIVYPVLNYSNSGGVQSLSPDAADLSLTTVNAVSPVVPASSVIITVIVFTLLYLVLAIAWFYLMKRYVAKGAPLEEVPPEVKADLDESKPLTFSY